MKVEGDTVKWKFTLKSISFLCYVVLKQVSYYITTGQLSISELFFGIYWTLICLYIMPSIQLFSEQSLLDILHIKTGDIVFLLKNVNFFKTAMSEYKSSE